MTSFISINPTTGEEMKRFEPLDGAALEEKVSRAVAAFEPWRLASFEERAACMRRAAGLLDEEKQRWGEVMTLEMGKPIKAAVAEAEKCAWVCRHYADQAAAFLADEPAETDASRSYVRYQPLGPILAIMPWNFPFWQLFRFAAPAIMAGNVALLKHAPNVPQCALAIEEIFSRAGFPPGVMQNLFIEPEAARALLADRRIRAATLTGSVRAGRSVAEAAGAWLKKVVLELGGSDPFIVLPSADLENAVKIAVAARVLNNGQSCIAAKRFIVHKDVANDFEEAFLDRMAALRIGDPLDPAVEIGPLARQDLQDGLAAQVEASVAAGARLLLGGRPLDRPGYFFPPSVLANIPRESPAYGEELFGPVASLFRVNDLGEAIALANDTTFGLGASAWTADPAEQERLANEVESGAVFINGMVKSDPRLPFGGVKDSGFGRELGVHGIREFVNVKTVWIA
ncbi:MAG: NAD-dependent succinate-semialdehyde dehydrogenase [Chloroflexi bacterium]|nr:NAD-dependent succinate-semialdehyde dehydrogenase [Chloroflexota bacterium]MCI0575237.1 NAD-dependent succinate-semialdehyde dehydrogenase [Chloroflexota bacterium]MCI0648842.1 NAD-dependent succinate-semialdehyde dehydrogenase [Chloroflexota bacterium]MCI0726597.1 NAD-dependent succinate-semialdehyde dehydrogenase [Chloroflexota bacterium]